MSTSIADKVLKEVYDIFSIDYIPGTRAQAPRQVSANPTRFGRIFNPSVMAPFTPSPSTPVPLLTQKGFLQVAVIEVLCDPSRQWGAMSRMLKKVDLPQYRGWGDLPRNVLPDHPDQRMVERVADSTAFIKMKSARELAAAQMGLMLTTRVANGMQWVI
jgi:hypothetical protein